MVDTMTLLGNIIWFIFGGVFACIGWFAAGITLCLTIIGIPFGLQAFKLGIASLTPFGKEVIEVPDANSPLRILFNIVWILLPGPTLALHHLFWAVVLGITIVGIPFAKQHLKLIPLCLFPFGRDLKPSND